MLLAVPNISEGRDAAQIGAIGDAFASVAGVRLLDVHSDPDHNRSVYTLAGAQGDLARALLAGATEAVARLDLGAAGGVHPLVGVVDVAPIVHLGDGTRGAACAEALVVASDLADQLGLAVLLYGVLAQGRTRAQLRHGGPEELARRLDAGELTPDFGPARPHPTAGATLVAARAPLVAFNLVLAPPATLQQARAVASAIREGGSHGLVGVRALGVELTRAGGHAQVTCNVEDPLGVPLARLVEAVRSLAAVDRVELVGLAPRAAFEGFPADMPIAGFDPGRHLIESALGL